MTFGILTSLKTIYSIWIHYLVKYSVRNDATKEKKYIEKSIIKHVWKQYIKVTKEN